VRRCVVFTLLVMSAESVSIEIDGFGSFEYPKIVKLSKKKCQNVFIEYQIDENLDLDGAAMAIQIGDISKKKLYGGAAWFGVIPNSNSEPMPMIGRLSIKVCQSNWTFRTMEYRAIKAKTYDLFFGYGRYFDESTFSKASKTVKIKFVN